MRVLGIKVIGLTEAAGSELVAVVDLSVEVQETETYIIQELHL